MAKKQQADPIERQKLLEEDIKRFLKAGGKIQKIEEGITGEKHPWLKGRKTDRPCTVVNLPNHIAPGQFI
ncbi:MAG: hypothetical protein MK185_03775 [Saccharospirillaceae bacterium]|jgi:hypothetical protein|nr:hypothetical protein A3759_11495 [Thalassolituus sp. HI0120]KZZ47878.1 hypothetical protein A3759_28785 [Thalassolituus sp. HI0120]MCH2039733.1 hypothetical protein [Saccharospirillaceae bacterium]